MNRQEEMPPECSSAELLAEYLEGCLTTEERTLVEQHLVACGKCRQIVSTACRATDSVIDPPDSV